MLAYAEKLTAHPGKWWRPTWNPLRSVGFSDRECSTSGGSGLLRLANRIVDGLGVSLESWITED
ncbi:MAG: hypothetical protein Ct9H300mP12_10320 [Acidimicrobiales bacterium]|nr:MAG: hypothetical protein Ct9H300mP12_10320 [Acidimicrobiales bacterium]